jgi:hypothetical protein
MNIKTFFLSTIGLAMSLSSAAHDQGVARYRSGREAAVGYLRDSVDARGGTLPRDFALERSTVRPRVTDSTGSKRDLSAYSASTSARPLSELLDCSESCRAKSVNRAVTVIGDVSESRDGLSVLVQSFVSQVVAGKRVDSQERMVLIVERDARGWFVRRVASHVAVN